MKNIAVTVLIAILLGALVLYLVSFQVRQTESVLITTFGRPVRTITEPGCYFKWPVPIQQAYKFDSRMRIFEADLGETTTRGAVPIIVNTYAVWKVADPLTFFNANNSGTIKEAETKLLGLISNTQNKVVGNHDFSEFVNSDPAKIPLDQIQDEMLADMKDPAGKNYGITVCAVGIKQLKISEDVSKDVFERMKAERNRKTQAIMAEGNAEATKIKTDADSKKAELLAAAEARAMAIRGQGDAEAAKYYKMLEADPELAMFLRDIDALKKILEQRSTVVLSADTEPFKLLRQMPELRPKK